MKDYCLALVLAAVAAIPGAACDGGSDPADDDDDVTGGADAAPPDPDAGLAACDVTPPAWAAPNFATNAAEALALRGQVDLLTGTTMRGGEQETLVIDDVADLTSLYEAGNPSLAFLVAAPLDAIVDDVFAEFVALVLAGPQDLVDDNGDWVPGAAGGIFGASSRGVNAGGLELRQVLDKTLFGGGALYAYALGLSTGDITPATVDAMAAAWGSNDAMSTDPLTDSAGYAFRMGFHAEIAQALTDAKAYASSAACAAERDAAIVAFFGAWEQALVARTVYYANSAAERLAGAETDDDISSGLHGLSEGVGLTLGFYGLPDPTTGPLAGAGRSLTDADIAAMMSALGVDLTDLGASTIGLFVAEPKGLAAGVLTFEARVMQVFSLDPVDIESFRSPTEG